MVENQVERGESSMRGQAECAVALMWLVLSKCTALGTSVKPIEPDAPAFGERIAGFGRTEGRAFLLSCGLSEETLRRLFIRAGFARGRTSPPSRAASERITARRSGSVRRGAFVMIVSPSDSRTESPEPVGGSAGSQ